MPSIRSGLGPCVVEIRVHSCVHRYQHARTILLVFVGSAVLCVYTTKPDRGAVFGEPEGVCGRIPRALLSRPWARDPGYHQGVWQDTCVRKYALRVGVCHVKIYIYICCCVGLILLASSLLQSWRNCNSLTCVGARCFLSLRINFWATLQVIF